MAQIASQFEPFVFFVEARYEVI